MKLPSDGDPKIDYRYPVYAFIVRDAAAIVIRREGTSFMQHAHSHIFALIIRGGYDYDARLRQN